MQNEAGSVQNILIFQFMYTIHLKFRLQVISEIKILQRTCICCDDLQCMAEAKQLTVKYKKT